MFALAAGAAPQRSPTQAERDLHRRVLVVDAHCDITQDIAYQGYDLAPRHADPHARAGQVRENESRGVRSALFGVEGGHMLQPGSPDEQLAHSAALRRAG